MPASVTNSRKRIVLGDDGDGRATSFPFCLGGKGGGKSGDFFGDGKTMRRKVISDKGAGKNLFIVKLRVIEYFFVIMR